MTFNLKELHFCLTSFSVSHWCWTEAVMSNDRLFPYYSSSKNNLCFSMILCLHPGEGSPRHKTFPMHRYASSQQLFCWWGIRKSAQAWNCCYCWHMLLSEVTNTIRQLWDSLWGINWNIYFSWHNSSHLLL